MLIWSRSALKSGNYDKAFGFFDLNIRNYPNSQKVYDSMGDFYVAVVDNSKAIEYFKKALAFGNNEATREKLVKLQLKSEK